MGYQVYVSGLQKNSIQIITFRAIQGIGSAIIAPTTLALLMGHFEGRKEVKPLVTTAPPWYWFNHWFTLGGWLTSTISWRSGFLINVPFTIILIILTLLL